jgi:hypothetical protein
MSPVDCQHSLRAAPFLQRQSRLKQAVLTVLLNNKNLLQQRI